MSVTAFLGPTTHRATMRPHIRPFLEDTFFNKENSNDTSNRAAFPLRSPGSPLQKRNALGSHSQSNSTKRRKTFSSPSLRSDPLRSHTSSLLHCTETIPNESSWLDETDAPRPVEMIGVMDVPEPSKRSPVDPWAHLLSPTTMENVFGITHSSPGCGTPQSRLSDGGSIPFDLDLSDFDPSDADALPLSLPDLPVDNVPFLFDIYPTSNPQSTPLLYQMPSADEGFPDPVSTLHVSDDSHDSPLGPSPQESLQSEWGTFDLSPLEDIETSQLKQVPILPHPGANLTMLASSPLPRSPPRLPVGIARPPNRTVDDTSEVIRISWMNNSKTGWHPIRPFPRAISRAKKFVLDPIRINKGGMKFTVTVSENLALALAGEESTASVSLPSTNDLPVSDTLPLVESGQAIEVNCCYERPRIKNKRATDWVRIHDQSNRLVFEWSFSVFNPKWETMTKSTQKPIAENSCSFAWLCGDEWKLVTGKLPA